MDKPPPLKPLYWLGSSKRDLLSLPGPVEDLFGYALYLAQDGKKHELAPQGLRLRGRSGGCRGLESEHASCGLHGAIRGCRVRAAYISEEVHAWSSHA